MEMTENQVKSIALTDIHVALGAKMVPFAGYLMPVSYAGINVDTIFDNFYIHANGRHDCRNL